MKKASIGIAAILAILLILAVAISLNITGGIKLVKAGPEECNGLDDDGDSYIDEDFTYFDPIFNDSSGIGNQCFGINECNTSIGYVICRDLNTADCSVNIEGNESWGGSTELCDYKDNDCNGLFDEDFQYWDSTWPAYLDVGTTGCYGINACNTSSGTVYCKDTSTADCTSNDPGSGDYGGSPETCNSLDDDCDTEVDEGGVCDTISITLYGYPIDFGPCDPGTIDNAGTGNPYIISVDSVTGPNVDLYQNGTNFTIGGSSFGIGNMTWNKINNTGSSVSVTNDYNLIESNISPNTNTTIYYWLNVPGGKPAGSYTSTINIKAVQTGTSP